ncbi:helix-turn-helix domain-containing protein [Lactobacillus sp. B4005]|uniref:helix-turn-helix domain-containing protein n=1 Tax=Lactobacillus sp. B4005 TaxID=2818031 RepID=UPI003A5CBF12
MDDPRVETLSKDDNIKEQNLDEHSYGLGTTHDVLHEYLTDFDTINTEEKLYSGARRDGVDLDVKYLAMVVSSVTNLPEWRLAFDLDKNNRVYVMRPKQESKFLTSLPKETKVGIGKRHFDLSGSIKEALFALLLSNKFDSIVQYDEVANMYSIVHSSLDYPDVRKKLSQLDEDTQLTLWLYTKEQATLSSLARILMVHPKTIEYRLEKIRQATQLNPKVGIDLLPLTVAYLKEKTDSLGILETELQSFSDDMLPRDRTISVSID